MSKSVITLTALWELLLDRFDIARVLVIAPKRVAEDTWPAEIAKWDHLKGLTCSLVLGTEKQRRAALNKKAMLYIINRENVAWLVENHRWDFDALVIDELSSFKSSKAQRFRALKKVRPLCRRVIGLTGTPAPNTLIDLWPQIYLLDMGKRLGRFVTHFRGQYFLPDKRSAQQVFTYKPRPGAESEIYRRIGDICVSMKAADHLRMPELVSSRVEVCLSAKEQKLYDTLKREGQTGAPLPRAQARRAGRPDRSGHRQAAAGGLLVQARPRSHPRALRRPPHRHGAGHRRLERGEDRRGADPPSLGGPWSQLAGGRLDAHLVYADVVPGTVSADERAAVAAGAEKPGGGHPPHHRQGHARRGRDAGAGAQGHGTGRADPRGQGTDRRCKMTAKEFLGQAYRLDQRITSKLQQIESLRCLTQKVTQAYGGEAVSRTRNVSSLEDSILRLMEAEEELNRQIDTLVDTKIEIGKLIDRVHNETYRLILDKRYLCFMNWDRIAEELHYSRRWVLSRHERALEVADKLLREKEGIA